jgi:hypothetical protein
MKALVVVYKRFGASIIERVFLEHPPSEVRVLGTGDRSSVLSAGGWSLRNYGCRALVVVDSESTYEDAIQGLRGDLEDLMINRRLVTVHMAVPEVAVALFASPEHLAEILGVEIAREELIRAEYVPGDILDLLIERSPRVHSRDELMQQVSGDYVCRIREHPLMREIECSLVRAMDTPIEGLLPGDVQPLYARPAASSQLTGSPTRISPSSSTSAKAPPPQSGRMAS